MAAATRGAAAAAVSAGAAVEKAEGRSGPAPARQADGAGRGLLQQRKDFAGAGRHAQPSARGVGRKAAGRKK